MQKLEPYHGSGKKVVVYNTYADKGRLHFDVFVPTDKSQSGQVSKDVDAKAVEYAKEFLKLIGKPSDDVAVNMCERCHIDNTDLYAEQLWQLPGKEVFIWPMEGCPKPQAPFLFLQGTGVLQSIYAADSRASVTISPFFQLAGSSVVVRAEGLAPNTNATIYAKNVVAKVETVKAGQLEDTVTTTYRLEDTVKIIVVDQFGNSATGELTVIRWITESPF